MSDTIQKFKQIIETYDNIVFFGGAGVSTESGIPDFRSVDGLYNAKYDYPPEQILSHTYYTYNRKGFYRFYKDKMLYPMPSQTRVTRHSPNWKKWVKFVLLLHRTLTVFTKQPVAKPYMSCMAVFFVTIAKTATSSMT